MHLNNIDDKKRAHKALFVGTAFQLSYAIFRKLFPIGKGMQTAATCAVSSISMNDKLGEMIVHMD